jgi:hypothetical protein
MAAFLSAGLSAQVPPVADMARRVFAVIGPAPRECGRRQLRQSGRMTLDPPLADLQTSLECVRQAIAARQPFWTFVQRRGIDSFVAHGLLGTTNGEVQYFDYDSSPCGGPRCGGELTLAPCTSPSVKPASADGEAADFECLPR